MFYIDGIECDVICEIERVTEVRSSEISGTMLDGSYFNDVVGSFLQYNVTIKVPLNQMDKYATIYELLTEPVDGHQFILPYNQGTIEITARVENVSDKYSRLPGGRKYWRDTSFSIIANHPSKQISLGEAISRGRTPLPEITDPEEGDTYTYHNGAWVVVPNADEMYF